MTSIATVIEVVAVFVLLAVSVFIVLPIVIVVGVLLPAMVRVIRFLGLDLPLLLFPLICLA